MTQGAIAYVAGVGMTDMSRRDRSADQMAREAAGQALGDAGIAAREVGTVILANAAGGRLCDQACIRGQTWLRDLGLEGAPVVNVDNSCASGSTALHVATMAAQAGRGPVLAVGVEKMWIGDRLETLAGVEDGLPAEERPDMRRRHDNESGSVLMGMNSTWMARQIAERGTTALEIAQGAVKARRCGARNPFAQFRTVLTLEEVLHAPVVAGGLTRPMCSSFTDGAAAAVVGTTGGSGTVRITASVARSGNGDLDYHDRMREAIDEAWKVAGVGPDDVDVLELHDATSAEEIYALESLGFFAVGEAGAATAAGRTDLGGDAVFVNPSGGLVARGHPLGATGLAQVVELVWQLRGQATGRQAPHARVAVAVNSGGIIAGDTALAAVHILQAN